MGSLKRTLLDPLSVNRTCGGLCTIKLCFFFFSKRNPRRPVNDKHEVLKIVCFSHISNLDP